MPTPAIPLTAVTSSIIEAAGYDAESSTLAIRFKPWKEGTEGSLYHYKAVPEATWREMEKAESQGKYFTSSVKPFYKHEKIST